MLRYLGVLFALMGFLGGTSAAGQINSPLLNNQDLMNHEFTATEEDLAEALENIGFTPDLIQQLTSGAASQQGAAAGEIDPNTVRDLLNALQGVDGLYGGDVQDVNTFARDADETAIAVVGQRMSKLLHEQAAAEGRDVDNMTLEEVGKFVGDNLTREEAILMTGGKIRISKEDFNRGVAEGTKKENLNSMLQQLR